MAQLRQFGTVGDDGHADFNIRDSAAAGRKWASAIYAEMFHVKHRPDGGATRFCKTTLWIKNRPCFSDTWALPIPLRRARRGHDAFAGKRPDAGVTPATGQHPAFRAGQNGGAIAGITVVKHEVAAAVGCAAIDSSPVEECSRRSVAAAAFTSDKLVELADEEHYW